MNSTITFTLPDGVRVVVPDSLELATPYVLTEQQDWFEDEIRFQRCLLRSGQKVIDIGASYGVYALSMARTVGPTGCVWAFEPTSSTARLLAEGIAVNGFTQVVLDRSALSNVSGTAQLSLNKDPELNALIHGKSSSSPGETVPLTTLNECMERYGWRDIDFMKIDAEGEEANILKGGTRFFAELSPLVQYEVKTGDDLHMELVQDFAALYYDSYRLVPGLGLLVRYDTESPPDEYLLNLFCCKRDRAERLAADGFLLDPSAAGAVRSRDPDEIETRDAYDWRKTILKLPYAAQLGGLWEQTSTAESRAEIERALSLYAFSRDASRSPTERFLALQASFDLLRALCEHQPSHLRLASLARAAQDYGARSLAVGALLKLNQAILQQQQVDPSEPFLAPGERFDAVPPGEALANWILAAVLEGLERLGSFSSFYTGSSARRRLEMIRALGFGSAEMERRLRLLQKRFGVPAS